MSQHLAGPMRNLGADNRRADIVEWAGAVVFAATLLLPQTDPPWMSFWRDWTAGLAMMLFVLSGWTRLRAQGGRPLWLAPASLPGVVVLLGAVAWVQWAIGLTPYLGDALIFTAYALGFVLCVVTAQSLSLADRAATADRLAMAFLVAAAVSAPIAVLQWLGVLNLELDVSVAWGRPVAQLGQPNMLCSLLWQGVFGVWRLQARGRLSGRLALGAAVLFVAVGLLTQSRVAWVVLLTLWAVWLLRRGGRLGADWRPLLRPLALLSCAMLLADAALFWAQSRYALGDLTVLAHAGDSSRVQIWAMVLDSIGMRPWLGWGVSGNGAAQYAVALRHPNLMWYFSSAHNIVLDVAVWFGIPLASLTAMALFGTVWRRLMAIVDLPQMITLLAGLALLLHGLVELPLLYLYFLLPVGLMLGLSRPEVEGARGRAKLRLSTRPRALVPLAALGLTALFALLARIYPDVANDRPGLAFDPQNHLLVLTANAPVADLLPFDQLQSFQAFAATPLRGGLPSAVLASLRTPMLRTPYVPAIFRYALMMGLNDRPDEARDALRHVCKMEYTKVCAQHSREWAVWRRRWPQLPAWPEDADGH